MSAFPSLTYRDVDAALAFLARAFGAVVQDIGRDDAGATRFASVQVGGGVVLIQADQPEELHGTHLGQGWVYVEVDDVDAHYARVRDARAIMLGDPHDASEAGVYGYSVRDLEGNLWSFGTSR